MRSLLKGEELIRDRVLLTMEKASRNREIRCLSLAALARDYKRDNKQGVRRGTRTSVKKIVFSKEVLTICSENGIRILRGFGNAEKVEGGFNVIQRSRVTRVFMIPWTDSMLEAINMAKQLQNFSSILPPILDYSIAKRIPFIRTQKAMIEGKRVMTKLYELASDIERPPRIERADSPEEIEEKENIFLNWFHKITKRLISKTDYIWCSEKERKVHIEVCKTKCKQFEICPDTKMPTKVKNTPLGEHR